MRKRRKTRKGARDLVYIFWVVHGRSIGKGEHIRAFIGTLVWALA